MLQSNVVDEIKTHILCSITFYRKSCRLWDNAEKYGTARQARDNKRRMRGLFKTTHTHSEYVLPIQQWCPKRASLLSSTYRACLVEDYTWWYVKELLTLKD